MNWEVFWGRKFDYFYPTKISKEVIKKWLCFLLSEYRLYNAYCKQPNTNNKYFDKLESSHAEEYDITTYKNMFIEVYL